MTSNPNDIKGEVILFAKVSNFVALVHLRLETLLTGHIVYVLSTARSIPRLALVLKS